MVTIADIVRLMNDAGIARGRADSLVPDQPLDEQGLDSYDRMSLLTEIEEQYSLDLPNAVASRLRTLTDVVNHLNSLG